MASIDFGMNVINFDCCGGGNGGQNLDIFDENGKIKAELLPDNTSESTLNLYMCTNASDTPKDVSWQDENGNYITGTLVASESTMSKIYFVLQNKDANAYNQYATFRTGEKGSYVYEWKCIGSGIYENAQVIELDNRVSVLEDNAEWKDA